MVALSEVDTEKWSLLTNRTRYPLPDGLIFNHYGDIEAVRQAQHRLTTCELTKLKTLRSQGLTLIAIARELKIHRHTVSYHLSRSE